MFASIVLICIINCSEVDSEQKLPAYANKSGKTVKIVATAEGHSPYEKRIDNNDTLHNDPTNEWNVLFLIGCESAYCATLSRVELHFLDDPQKCLIFDGPIKHDGIDIRSLESYKKGKRLDNITNYITEYVYTITPENRANAKEDYCPLDI